MAVTCHVILQVMLGGLTHWTVGLVATIMAVACIIAADTGAYIFGSLMGRTQLISLSPKKTVEGAVGGALCSISTALCSWRLFAWPASPWVRSAPTYSPLKKLVLPSTPPPPLSPTDQACPGPSIFYKAWVLGFPVPAFVEICNLSYVPDDACYHRMPYDPAWLRHAFLDVCDVGSSNNRVGTSIPGVLHDAMLPICLAWLHRSG